MKILPYKTDSKYNYNHAIKNSYITNFSMYNFKDTISFSSAKVNKDDAFMLRNIKHLPCACCGKDMINEKDYVSLKSKDFQGPASQVLKKLRPYYKNMRQTEKTVYNILKRTSPKYPDADLNTLINKRLYYHIARLEAKQLQIINKAISSVNLNIKDQKALEKTMQEVHKILFVEPKDKPQKRNRILEELYILRYQADEKNKIDKILKTIEKLPNSQNDVDSFIVKYAERGNREIGQRLLSPSLPTLDHIKPASKSGKDDFSNLIVLCSKCNNERDSIPYQKWFLIKPEMKKNIQKYMDKVIMEIKNKHLPDFEFYPASIKRTLEKETKGKYTIKID